MHLCVLARAPTRLLGRFFSFRADDLFDIRQATARKNTTDKTTPRDASGCGRALYSCGLVSRTDALYLCFGRLAHRSDTPQLTTITHVVAQHVPSNRRRQGTRSSQGSRQVTSTCLHVIQYCSHCTTRSIGSDLIALSALGH